MNNPSLDLVEFVEKNILPQYANFDKAHNMEHVTRVIRRSLDLARKIGADLDMAYAIAAYHDLGLSGPRAIHHLTSGKILLADARLKRWFSQDKLTMMKEAVEDHRASPVRHAASTEESSPRLTATSTQRPSSAEPSSSDFPTIRNWMPRDIGSVSCNTWTRSIASTAISASGFKVLRTSAN